MSYDTVPPCLCPCRDKTPQEMSDLDDKSELASFKPVFDRYGHEFVESMYEKVTDYEDEYDDTYDSNLIGADDADSADELTHKKYVVMTNGLFSVLFQQRLFLLVMTLRSVLGRKSC